MTRKKTIQESVATNPIYTSNSFNPQPRESIDRSEDVARVKGSPIAMFLK